MTSKPRSDFFRFLIALLNIFFQNNSRDFKFKNNTKAYLSSQNSNEKGTNINMLKVVLIEEMLQHLNDF